MLPRSTGSATRVARPELGAATRAESEIRHQTSEVRSEKPEVVSHSAHLGASGFLEAAPGAGAACGWLGLPLKTAATFDVFHRLQVTNYGLFNIPFESAPNGLDHVDVWLLCILAQTVSPLFRGNLLATSPGERKPKN